MADALDEMLVDLRTSNALDLAAVSTDGLMVAADHADGIDAENVCATAGDAFLTMAALGAQLNRGEPEMLTIEYDDGTVVVSPLPHGGTLILLAAGHANLGRLRMASRRFRDQYLAVMEAV